MADGKGGKKGKKVKGMKMDLSAFNTLDTEVINKIADKAAEKLDWAQDFEEALAKKVTDTTGDGRTRNASFSDKNSLPSAPRSMVERDADFERAPHDPPFLLVMENAPFDASEDHIEQWYHPIPLKRIAFLDYQGRKGKPQVEFNTREDLLKAWKEKSEQVFQTRKINLRLPSEMSGGESRGGRRDNQSGFNRDNRRDNQPDEPRDLPSNWRTQTSSAPSNFDERDRDEGFISNTNRGHFDSRSGAPSDRSDRGRYPPSPLVGTFERSDSRDERRAPRATPYGDLPPPGFDSRPPRRNDYDRDSDSRSGYSDRDRRHYGGERSQGGFQRNDSFNRTNSYGSQMSERDRDVQITRAPYQPQISHDSNFSQPSISRQQSRDFSRQHSRDSVPPTSNEGPVERPRLNLQPRSKPLESTGTSEQASLSRQSSNIFGEAKPVDTNAREKEVEEKLRRDEEQRKAQLQAKPSAEETDAKPPALRQGTQPTELRRSDPNRAESNRDTVNGERRSGSSSANSARSNVPAPSDNWQRNVTKTQPVTSRPVPVQQPTEAPNLLNERLEQKNRILRQTSNTSEQGDYENVSDIASSADLGAAAEVSSHKLATFEQDFDNDDEVNDEETEEDGFTTVVNSRKHRNSHGQVHIPNSLIYTRSKAPSRGGSSGSSGRGSYSGTAANTAPPRKPANRGAVNQSRAGEQRSRPGSRGGPNQDSFTPR